MAADAKKKPGLALAVMVGAKKGADAPKEDDSYGASVDELADVLGVSDDKRDAFREAFEAAVMSCK